MKYSYYARWYLILIIAIFFVSGCQSTKRIVAESEYVRAVMRTGAPVDSIKSASLTNLELTKLTHAANIYANFADKYRSPADALKYGGDELKQDYLKLKNDGYLVAYEIARENWLEYDTQTRDKMREWHRHATRLDSAALEHYRVEKYTDMAAEIMEYVRIGAQVLINVATKQ